MGVVESNAALREGHSSQEARNGDLIALEHYELCV
jgi:hypothetical protein